MKRSWPTSYSGSFSKWPANGHNPYVFPLAILLAKGEKLAVASMYLESLYSQLDEWVVDVIPFMGRYEVVTRVTRWVCIS